MEVGITALAMEQSAPRWLNNSVPMRRRNLVLSPLQKWKSELDTPCTAPPKSKPVGQCKRQGSEWAGQGIFHLKDHRRAARGMRGSETGGSEGVHGRLPWLHAHLSHPCSLNLHLF